MRTAAILPVKRFDAAKQRLGGAVAEALRGRLARAMAEDVIAALARVDALEQTLVVTSEPQIASHARELGAQLIGDEGCDGQSAAVALGVARALEEGFERVLCVPGDCPALDPAELEELLAVPAHEVVIVPDRHGTGTNGLLLSPPDAITPGFGPGSFARHRALAAAAGTACRLARPSSLLLDIDTGEDLEALRHRPRRGGEALARRTRELLGQPASDPLISING